MAEYDVERYAEHATLAALLRHLRVHSEHCFRPHRRTKVSAMKKVHEKEHIERVLCLCVACGARATVYANNFGESFCAGKTYKGLKTCKRPTRDFFPSQRSALRGSSHALVRVPSQASQNLDSDSQAMRSIVRLALNRELGETLIFFRPVTEHRRGEFDWVQCDVADAPIICGATILFSYAMRCALCGEASSVDDEKRRRKRRRSMKCNCPATARLRLARLDTGALVAELSMHRGHENHPETMDAAPLALCLRGLPPGAGAVSTPDEAVQVALDKQVHGSKPSNGVAEDPRNATQGPVAESGGGDRRTRRTANAVTAAAAAATAAAAEAVAAAVAEEAPGSLEKEGLMLGARRRNALIDGAFADVAAAVAERYGQLDRERTVNPDVRRAAADRLARFIDHTLLKPVSRKADIERLCEEALAYSFRAVCVNSAWVATASKALQAGGNSNRGAGDVVDIAAVVGFPLGAAHGEAKAAEAKVAVREGAAEIDMVINMGALLDGDYLAVVQDIQAVVEAAQPAIVKVILECGALPSLDDIARGCVCALYGGAAFVKTSTGFGYGGAKIEHVELMKRVVGSRAEVKASGGVKDAATARRMLRWCTRIGASAGQAIVDSDGKDIAMAQVDANHDQY